MKVTVKGELIHQCPHVEEQDVGTVEIVFVDDAPELHAVSKYLMSFAPRVMSHEEVTKEIANRYLGRASRVTTRWVTAGLAVECST